MKKGFISVFGLMLLLVGCSKASLSEINEDIKINKMMKIISSLEINYYQYRGYFFFSDGLHNFVVKEDIGSKKVEKVFQCEIIIPTDDDFNKVNVGDDIYTVVEKIGLPIFDGAASGLSALMFGTHSENLYSIMFDDTNDYLLVIDKLAHSM